MNKVIKKLILFNQKGSHSFIKANYLERLVELLIFQLHRQFHPLSFHLCYLQHPCLRRGLMSGRERCSNVRLSLLLISSSSSSAVYQLCAVPTGCSSGLRPCMWRWGAEGRRAPGRGSRTGAAGTVLLPQERAVQTAWQSGQQNKATHPNTKDTNKHRHAHRRTI